MPIARRSACLAHRLAMILLLASAPALHAEDMGEVTGQVVNGLTGEPVRGAAVRFEGTDVLLATDVSGLFRGSAAVGERVAVVSKADFESTRVSGLQVVAGKVVDFSAVLMPLAAAGGPRFEEEITVEAASPTVATEAAILVERKAAAQVSDAIGATEIGKNTGSDAAGVLKRVTGISLQDDKYVFVRGLGERYSNTSLNGSRIPSTEFEKKVVPLDLFPSDLLQKVRVMKSYSVDRAGDFAAGLVELETLEFPQQQQAAVGVSFGQNSITTGEPYLAYGGGLSFSGSGGQALPGGVPGQPLVRTSSFRPGGFTPAELETIGEQMVGTWSPAAEDAPYDRGFDLSYGNTFGRLGVVLSATHDNEIERRQEERTYFSVRTGGGVEPKSFFDIDYGEEKVREAAMANFALRASGNHHLQVRSLYTTLASSEGRLQEGFFSDVGDNIRDLRVSYLDQEIWNAQLSGEHNFERLLPGGSLLAWRASTSEATTGENRREANYQESTPGRFLLTDNAQSGFMYFNDLEDTVDDGAVDWTGFFSGARIYGSAKLGGAYTRNQRTFDGRRLRFSHRGRQGLDLTLPPDQLFVPANIRPDGFEIEEITRATDRYEGDHTVEAAYLQTDLSWGKWRLIGGVRAESSEIEVVTLDRTRPELDPVVTVLQDDDWLPSLSLVYQLGDDMNLRLAGSRTVNRPEFRELAPFTFTHIVGGFAVTGNPELVSASIDSADLRWEWFPAADEVVAVSLFYKRFDRPIESVIVGAVTELESFANADSARNYGLELELRRGLGDLWESLSGVTAILNYTYVDSQIEIDPAQTILTNPSRPLAGQPEQVVNAVLEWAARGGDTGVRLLYNLTGDKVASGGALGLPDVIEEERATLDLVWRQGLGRRLSGLGLKLSATNLLAEERLWTQGGEVFRLYDSGRSFGISVSYDLF
jgi:outer membrane receptor protein involved in Fe transport